MLPQPVFYLQTLHFIRPSVTASGTGDLSRLLAAASDFMPLSSSPFLVCLFFAACGYECEQCLTAECVLEMFRSFWLCTCTLLLPFISVCFNLFFFDLSFFCICIITYVVNIIRFLV